jgi:hypothetical protein
LRAKGFSCSLDVLGKNRQNLISCLFPFCPIRFQPDSLHEIYYIENRPGMRIRIQQQPNRMRNADFGSVPHKVDHTFFFFCRVFAWLVQLLFRGAIHPRILVGPPVGCSSTLDDPVFGGCRAGDSNPGPPYSSQALCPLDHAPPLAILGTY